MPRVSKKQSNSDVQIRSEADRGTEQVRSQGQRQRRSSIGSPKLTLAVQNDIPGYHLCWMNDDGNVENAVNSGYEFVTRGETELVYGVTPLNVDLADKIKQKVGTNEAGHPLYAIKWWGVGSGAIGEDQAGRVQLLPFTFQFCFLT